MNWTRYLGNAKPIESVYSNPPLLNEVRLHEVVMRQDGPRISLRFDLNSFPDNPPPRWALGNFNRAQLTLVLIALTDVSIQGWGLDNIGSIEITKNQEGVKLSFSGKSVLIVVQAAFIEVEKLSGYCDSERPNA